MDAKLNPLCRLRFPRRAASRPFSGLLRFLNGFDQVQHCVINASYPLLWAIGRSVEDATSKCHQVELADGPPPPHRSAGIRQDIHPGCKLDCRHDFLVTPGGWGLLRRGEPKLGEKSRSFQSPMPNLSPALRSPPFSGARSLPVRSSPLTKS